MRKLPIVILHGWGSSSEAWQAPKKLLEEESFQVYVPDLPGFGKEPPPKTAWSVSDYADFVLKFAKEKNLEKFVLIGHSFGGRVAIGLAANYPEKLTGLVLTGVPAVSRKTLEIMVFLFLSKIGKVVFLIPPLSIFAPWFRKFLYFLTGEWDYYKTEGVMRQTFKNIINEDLTPFLFKIKTPALLLWGENDKIIPVKTAYFLKEKIPQAELRIIKGGNHRFPYEKPEIFVREVMNFLPHCI